MKSGFFINSGGLVKFDPAIDASLRSNTLGAKYAVEFAKRCNDAVLIHLSTAYVCGMRPGKVAEALHQPYETYADGHRLETGETIPNTLEAEIEDILHLSEKVHADAHHTSRTIQFRREAQRQLGSGKRQSLKLDGQIDTVQTRWIEARLVEEGLKRAKSRGWNDTYTYTKSLGEQMIAKVKGDLPTAIVRPSIIESSLEEPEPGWLDGFRMADPIIIGFAKGRLPDFPGKPEAITDIIPVDLGCQCNLSDNLSDIPQTRDRGLPCRIRLPEPSVFPRNRYGNPRLLRPIPHVRQRETDCGACLEISESREISTSTST